MSYSLDQDQAQYFGWPDLGSTCLKGYQQTTLAGKESNQKSDFEYKNIV